MNPLGGMLKHWPYWMAILLSLPVKDISARTGLGDPSTLWRTFMQHLGVTPAEYRQRFAASGNEALASARER